jgi:pre-peptidase
MSRDLPLFSSIARRRVVVLCTLALLRALPVAAAPPPNDDFSNATVVSSSPFTDTVYVREATVAPDDPFGFGCGPVGSATIWYSFTPLSDMRIEANTFGSGPDTTLYVFTGLRGALTEIACNDNAAGRVQSQVFLPVMGGLTYHFLIGSHGLPFVPDNVTFSLLAAATPALNDDFDNATLIPAIPSTHTLDTTAASTAPDDPFCAGRGATVWYSLSVTARTQVEVNTSGSNYDTTLSVYVGARGGLTQIACNDEGGGGFARVRFEAVPGVTYFIMAGAFGMNPGGKLVLSVVPAPPPLEVRLDIDDRDSVVASTGLVTIRGTATCTRPAFLSLTGQVKQSHGNAVLVGFLGSFVFCDGPTAFTITTVSQGGLFHGRASALFVGGEADATLTGFAFVPDSGEFVIVNAMQSVLLTGSR